MITLKCTGDILMLESPSNKYWNNDIVNLLNQTDIVAGNLEMVLSGKNARASTFCGGEWLTTDKSIINDIKKFSFDYLNVANNHIMDFGEQGAIETCNTLTEENILYSGFGLDLARATKAVYKEINNSKIAFISCTASCDDAARAGNCSPTIPGRPGVSMLRHKETLFVEKKYLDVIDEIAEKTCVNARFMKSVKMGIHHLDKSIHRLGRLEFVESPNNKTEKITSCHNGDLERILNEIQIAKANKSTYIVVSIHSHDIKGMTDDTPDDYMIDFAHKCIDEGATIIIGTGTHQLKGIEIYKNSVIFYSLGNFTFKDEYLKYVPADFYERYNINYSATPEEIWSILSKNNTIGLEFDESNYLSIIPSITLDNGKIKEVSLIPIELGFNDPNKEKGFPYIANEEYAKKIFDRLNYLSKPFKTQLKLKINKNYPTIKKYSIEITFHK